MTPKTLLLRLAATTFAAALAATATAAETLSARGADIAVIDGDSLQIQGRVIDLAGIDAPEIGQLCADGERPWTCGLDAAWRLRKLVALQAEPVVCTLPEAGSTRGVCRIGDDDLALVQLRTGSATVDERVAASSYRAAERRARAAGLGVWAGGFVAPADWRGGRRLALEERAANSTAPWDGFPWTVMGVRILPVARAHAAGCLIKTVAAADGGRTYLSPLDGGYARIAAHGTTYCSDDEAREAGGRHAGEIGAVPAGLAMR